VVTNTIRIQARDLGFAVSQEEADDMRWLVEDGRRWISKSALERLAHCQEVKRAVAAGMLSSVRSANSAAAGAAEGIDWSQKDVIIEVDAQADVSPWELLDFEHGAIGLTCRSVAREPAERLTSSQVQKPARSVVNVLLVIARPYGTTDVPYLAVSKHFRRLLSEAGRGIRVTVLRPPTYEALVRALSKVDPFDVLHFDGHGDLRPGGPILLFENADGKTSEVGANAIVSLATNAGLKLIVLNACRSAQARPGAPTSFDESPTQSSLAYRLASQAGVPVVAMRYLVQADIAGRFVGAFYESLLDGSPVGAAVQCGRRALGADSRTGAPLAESDDYGEWLLPAYYSTQDELILVQPQQSPPHKATVEVRSVHGMDTQFLCLEKAFQAGLVPIICGPIGAGKLDLAHAYAAWFQQSSGGPADIQETVLVIVDRQQAAPLKGDAALAAAQRPECILIIRLSIPEPHINSADNAWLQALLRDAKAAVCRSIIVWDGAPRFVPSDPRALVVPLAELALTPLRAYALDADPDLDAGTLDQVADHAAGNPMYVRARAARVDLAATRWFTAAVDAHDASEIGQGMLGCLRQFEGMLNIFTLRRMMHETGVLQFPSEYFLLEDHDKRSQERSVLEKLTAGGLLIRLSPNTYLISPWLREVWSRHPPQEDVSGSLALVFARAVAETCVEYQMDYFSRGYRDVVLVIEQELHNIARAWVVLQGNGDFSGLVKLLSALAALWTLQQRFDLIEERAQELERRLLEGAASDIVCDSLLMIRLQAASAVGRVDGLTEAVQRAAERYLVAWQAEGQPRGTTREGIPSTYRNMLVAKQNWAAVLRMTKRRDLHRSVCMELLDEYEQADDGDGIIKVLKSMTMALAPRPLPEEARKLRDLLNAHYPRISKNDGVMLSEVLSDIAQLGLVAIEDQSSQEFGAALDQAIAWLNRALLLLPPAVGSNHAHIHQRLADCYLRKSQMPEMDEHFQSAIAIFERLGQHDHAAFCAASAADGWAFFRNRVRAREYARSAISYLSQTSNSPLAQEAIRIVRQLAI
jgi:tetratricopeptide (TPR) repeat protein